METITSKKELLKILQQLTEVYSKYGVAHLVKEVNKAILQSKIRFPLLEFFTKELYVILRAEDRIAFVDEIVALRTIGGNVIAGIILQLDISLNFCQSLAKAEEYILFGDAWYVCDIIGERVIGFALLNYPENTLPYLRVNAKHENKWIVRSIGVAGHYAIKKGLNKIYVEELFKLLLLLADTSDFHTKKGIGWAAKTTAKFYPDIIKKYQEQIDDSREIKQWFRTKIKIGLGRSTKYASKYNS